MRLGPLSDFSSSLTSAPMTPRHAQGQGHSGGGEGAKGKLWGQVQGQWLQALAGQLNGPPAREATKGQLKIEAD